MELNSTQNNEPKFAQLIMQEFAEKKSHWTMVAIIIAGIAGLFVVWWYVRVMILNEPMIDQQSLVNQDTRENAAISGSVENIDLGDIDAEFQSVDQDLNSL